MEEQILVIPSSELYERGLGQGFVLKSDDWSSIFGHGFSPSFMSRGPAESDKNFKQIISYMMVFREDEVFVTKRTPSGGEKRLVGMTSIGIGGHINDMDSPGLTIGQRFLEGSRREVKEEIVLKEKVPLDPPTIIPWYFLGWINDDSTEVGSVHLGIVSVLDVAPTYDVSVACPSMKDGRFEKFRDAANSEGEGFRRMESWAKIILSSCDIIEAALEEKRRQAGDQGPLFCL